MQNDEEVQGLDAVTWYAFYRISDGVLYGVSSTMPEAIPEGYTYKTYPTKPDFATHYWDEVLLDFLPWPPEEPENG